MVLPASALAEDTSAALYVGRLTANTWHEVFDPRKLTFVDSHIIVLTAAQRVATLFDRLDVELEGQVVRHFGAQDHWEFNLPAVLRWTAFPGENDLDISVAFGLGVSYASERPAAEIERKGESERLLAYWMIELETAVPTADAWSIFTRLHHRSTSYGLFGEEGGADVLALGLRYRF